MHQGIVYFRRDHQTAKKISQCRISQGGECPGRILIQFYPPITSYSHDHGCQSQSCESVPVVVLSQVAELDVGDFLRDFVVSFLDWGEVFLVENALMSSDLDKGGVSGPEGLQLLEVFLNEDVLFGLRGWGLG